MDITEAKKALRWADWSELLRSEDGTIFAAMVDGVPTIATKVFSEDKEDEDEDTNLMVVVEVAGQYFQKTGYCQIGSHCYGDYEPSWNELTEVIPTQKTVTVYETVS
jgi:hypothetical protein